MKTQETITEVLIKIARGKANELSQLDFLAWWINNFIGKKGNRESGKEVMGELKAKDYQHLYIILRS